MSTTHIDRSIFTKPVLEKWTSRARIAALVFAAVLVAAPLLAQRQAQPRSGGGGGGGGVSGGAHRPSGPSASAPSARGGGGGNWDGGGHRPPGSGGGAPHRPPGYDRDHGHGHGGYYYYPYHYPYYGWSFGFGYGYPYYYGYSPYYYGYPPYYYGYRPYYYGYRPYYYPGPYSYGYEGAYGPAGDGTAYDRASFGAVALKVKPKNAQVYVDGNFVGAAGSFDGFPGYLWIPPGTHRIELVQVGYTNLVQEIEVGSGQVVEIGQNMVRGESVRPAPPVNSRYDSRGGERAPYPENDYRAAPRYEPREPQEESRAPAREEQSGDMGGLFLEVRPDDASVYVDGRFVGTGRDVSTATEPLLMVPGEHRIQVVHPNYSNQERTIEVGPGDEKRVEVYLGRGAGV
jgi:hypothetical protein